MPHYLIISGEANWAYSIELDDGTTYRIGRAADNDIVLKDNRVSSYHARLTSVEGEYQFNDLESRNGSYIGDQRVRTVTLEDGIKVRLGHTTLQYVTRLDSASLSGAAILSPKLSQPLLRTEVRKLQELIGELGAVQDVLTRKKLDPADLERIGDQIGQVVARLRDVENHTRVLISTNHFHEIFHRQHTRLELHREALRFMASAVEAENCALAMLRGEEGKLALAIEGTFGLSVSGWPVLVPQPFHDLLTQCIAERRSIHIRSMAEDTRFQSSMDSARDGARSSTRDHRSILISPLITGAGRILGAAYFDNTTRPARLKADSSKLAEGCLMILADHLETVFGTGGLKETRNDMTQLLDSAGPDKTMLIPSE
ncbi:FHA domain-containing protein [Candidatus Poribacteria bacterium]|nr:FHA domain-containing protein [Candidatus Poribacteria bacterium]